MFKLEMLQARHGDCLLLHWGSHDKPALCLIDGGPATVFREVLRPRLKALAKQRANGSVAIDLLMVSHIDDDHINGVLALAKELDDNREGATATDGRLPVTVRRVWHNSLEGLLDDPLNKPATASVTASAQTVLATPPPTGPDSHNRYAYNKVLASVPQGQQLHGYVTRNSWPMNTPFEDPNLVVRRDDANETTIKGLTLTVVAPSFDELEKLRKAWKKNRKDGVLASYSDPSPYNLSSIVVLVEHDGARMLLTGDARGDMILAGLEALALMDDDGRIHVDLLKLPHHGSINNIEREFFDRVTADHYVVSGDRDKFPTNPSKQVMRWIQEARDGEDYSVHCSYEFSDMRNLFGDYFFTPEGDATSLIVDLGS